MVAQTNEMTSRLLPRRHLDVRGTGSLLSQHRAFLAGRRLGRQGGSSPHGNSVVACAVGAISGCLRERYGSAPSRQEVDDVA